MNFKSAYLYASGRCEGSPWPDEPRVAKAVQFAAHHEELAFLLERQRSLDLQALRALAALEIPAELASTLRAQTRGTRTPGGWKWQLRQPAILAPLCGLLLILGIVIFLAVLKAKTFPGLAAAQEMIETAQSMSGSDMEPVAKPGAEMGDWLFLKYGLEDFGVDAEFARVQVVGCRLLKQDGHPIAQMAAEPKLLLYVFRTADFGIQLPDADWHPFEQNDWVAAIRSRGTMCQMVAFPGTDAEMRGYLKKLARRSASPAP